MEDPRFAGLLRGDRLQVLAPEPFETVEQAVSGQATASLAGAVGSLLRLLDAIVAGAELGPPRDRRTLAALGALEERLNEPWTVDALAQIAGLDPATLTRRVRAETGLPPVAYLALLRCERAATLLRSSDLPVAAIGERVGWYDPNYFARRFRQHYGLSPMQYRSRYKVGV